MRSRVAENSIVSIQKLLFVVISSFWYVWALQNPWNLEQNAFGQKNILSVRHPISLYWFMLIALCCCKLLFKVLSRVFVYTKSQFQFRWDKHVVCDHLESENQRNILNMSAQCSCTKWNVNKNNATQVIGIRTKTRNTKRTDDKNYIFTSRSAS